MAGFVAFIDLRAPNLRREPGQGQGRKHVSAFHQYERGPLLEMGQNLPGDPLQQGQDLLLRAGGVQDDVSGPRGLILLQ